MQSPSSVVICSIVIRSFSLSFPFHKGKTMGNISKNDMIKNDATLRPEGTLRTVGDKYATLSERWGRLAKVGVIYHSIKCNFRAKRQASHWIVDTLRYCLNAWLCNCLSNLTAPATQTIKQSDNQAIINLSTDYDDGNKGLIGVAWRPTMKSIVFSTSLSSQNVSTMGMTTASGGGENGVFCRM